MCEVGPRDGLQNEKDVLAPKTRAELEESDEANLHIDKLSEKYTGNPKFQSHRPNERRVIVRVKPERVS